KTAAAVAAAAEAGLDLAPAPPAWVDGAQLPAWWTSSVTDLPGGRVLAVPVPAFLADDWPDLDVRCWWAGGVGFVCAYDSVTRRDRWPSAADRRLDPEVWRPIAASIGALGVRGLVRDGRDVVRWRFGIEGWTTEGLRGILARCAAVGDAEPWGLVGFSPDGVWVERTLTIA
nr:hypothetical protein [Deltaproteobacteria bacterium]